VPAATSSPILPVLAQLSGAPALRPSEYPGLLERLASIPDPRDRRGRRHALVSVLSLAAAAVLAGARSLTASPSGPLTGPSRSWPPLACAATR
jgi:hypothetical protein